MLVKELIAELQKCNPDDIVMYNIENSLKLSAGNLCLQSGEEYDYPIDDVLVGSGTLRGFVFLTEEE